MHYVCGNACCVICQGCFWGRCSCSLVGFEVNHRFLRIRCERMVFKRRLMVMLALVEPKIKILSYSNIFPLNWWYKSKICDWEPYIPIAAHHTMHPFIQIAVRFAIVPGFSALSISILFSQWKHSEIRAHNVFIQIQNQASIHWTCMDRVLYSIPIHLFNHSICIKWTVSVVFFRTDAFIFIHVTNRSEHRLAKINTEQCMKVFHISSITNM